MEDHELEVLPDGKILAMGENGYHILEEDILTSYFYDGIPTDIYGEKEFFLSKNYHLFVVEGGHRIFRSSEPFFDLPVNTTPLVKEEDFAFFPNPANEILNIQLKESMVNESVTLEFQNQLGQTILELKVSIANTKVDVAKLLSGLYYIVLKKDGKIIKTDRFVKI